MSKVITFSRNFPVYHPQSGKQTFFVEKILQTIYGPYLICEEVLRNLNPNVDKKTLIHFYCNLNSELSDYKVHTIRGGQRFKKGDWFSPRVWSGKPYNSKQIIIAPDQLIHQVYEIKIEGYMIWINKQLYSIFSKEDAAIALAENDGLSIVDFWNWFPPKVGQVFTGQIIIWDPEIKYVTN